MRSRNCVIYLILFTGIYLNCFFSLRFSAQTAIITTKREENENWQQQQQHKITNDTQCSSKAAQVTLRTTNTKCRDRMSTTLFL